MKNIKTLSLTVVISLLCSTSFAAVDKLFSAFTAVTTATNADYLLINTNAAGGSGTYATRIITASNLLQAMKGFPNWTGGSGSGTIVTNPNVLFVATNGNDTTAVKGLASQPWATITNALIAATNGDIIKIGPGTFYAQGRGEAKYTGFSNRLEAPLLVGGITNLTIEGEGRDTVIQYTNVGHIFSIFNSDGITFRNFRMKGPGSNLNNNSPKVWTNIFGAITLWSARGTSFSPGATNQNLRFENLLLEDVPDHGIVGVPDTRNFNIVVTGCEFRRIGDAYHPTAVGDGACVVSLGVGVVVTGNLFSDVQHAVEVENSFGSPSDTMSDWAIVGNTIRNAWRHGITIWPGPNATQSEWRRFVIANNSVGMVSTNYPDVVYPTPIQVAGGSDIVVEGNTISGFNDFGLSITPTINISNCVVSGNVIVDSTYSGISVENSATSLALNTKVSGNLVKGGGSFGGIWITASGTYVSDNTIIDTTGPGILLALNRVTTNTVIAGNNFQRIGSTNIIISANVTNTTIGMNYTKMGSATRLHDLGVGTIYSQPWIDGGMTIYGGLNVSDSAVVTNGATVYGAIQLGQTGAGATTTSSNIVRFYEDTHVHGDLYFQKIALTANRVLGITAGRSVATSTDITLTELNDILNNPNIATNISGAGTVTVTSNNTGGWTITGSGGSGGTNYPAILNQYTIATSTNIDVAVGTRKKLLFITNANFGVNLSGTAPSGMDLFLAISNSSASTIYLSNYVGNTLTGFYDYGVASNLTAHTIPANSLAFFTMNHVTNGYWWRVSTQQKEAELGVLNNSGVPFLAMWTNASGSLIGYSNIYPPQASSMVLSNIQGIASTNIPLGGTNISVRTTGGTNFIDTTGQLNNWGQFTTNVWNSRQGGSPILTNLAATTIDFQPNNVVTNLGGIQWNVWTNLQNTVSNFVFSFQTNNYHLRGQTNVIFTNIVELVTGQKSDIEVFVENTTGVTMGLVWPAYGAQHGYFLRTNANNAVLAATSLASGSAGIANFHAVGTNILATFITLP